MDGDNEQLQDASVRYGLSSPSSSGSSSSCASEDEPPRKRARERGYSSVVEHSTADREVPGPDPGVPSTDGACASRPPGVRASRPPGAYVPRRRDSSSSRDTAQEMERRFELLSQQLVSHVNKIFNNSAITVPVSTELNGALEDPFSRPTASASDILELNVSVKEPSVAIAKPERVAKLASMQRFNDSSWNSVRYAEVLKKYVATPVFTELKVNEELRRLENVSAPIRWNQMERSYAALSNAFLAQSEFVNLALHNLINGSANSNTQQTSSIYDKLKELFGNESQYKIVSQDILQIICGKRAEILELRRKVLLKGLRGRYIREDIEKIPPSEEYMFNPTMLQSYLQKIGGVEKLYKEIILPPKSSVCSKSPTRARSPVASTSRENNFRFQQINKTKGKKRNLPEHDKKKRGGGRKVLGHRNRNK